MTVLFNVNNDSYTQCTKEFDPDDEYSGESTETSHNVNSIDITIGSHFDVSGAFNEKDIVENVFLVYVVYSTGDSLSNHDCSGIEYIECFLSKDKALELVNTINIQNKIYQTYPIENGNKLDSYFQHLESIGIIEKLKEEDKALGKKFKESLYGRLYFKDESGDVKFLANPWSGYFEVLESVECLELPGVKVAQIKRKKIK